MSLIYELKTNIVYSVLGLSLGLAVNYSGKVIYDRLQITDRRVKVAGQMFFCALFLAVIRVYMPQEISQTILSETAGIMFIAFFFGVQYISFTSIQQIYGIQNI